MSPTLNALDLDLIRAAVLEMLPQEAVTIPALMTVDEVAAYLQVEPKWVRKHQVKLGAVRLGDGPGGRLRFPRESVEAYLASHRVGERTVEPKPKTRKGRRSRRQEPAIPALTASGTAVLDW